MTQRTQSSQSDAKTFSYILGNPPFNGKKEQKPEQKADLRRLFANPKAVGNLDFVTGWYRKAADLIRGTATECAFVSTNSITQGEQVPILWPELSVSINFAYRTFKWKNAAKGVAAVHCVIIGFADRPRKRKQLFSGDSSADAENINYYLVDAPNVMAETRATALSPSFAEMNYGSMPIDDGHLILSPEDRAEILAVHPSAEPFIRQYAGGDEFLNSKLRYCLWLVHANPSEWMKIPAIVERVRRVKEFRLGSSRAATLKLAATPSLFGEIRQPDGDYLLIPKVSSENREYIPIGFMSPDVIASGSALIVPKATVYQFGLLTSRMHNAWMRTVAGRMKSDYQYSKNIVYNNFIAPTPKPELAAKIEEAAQAVLDVRVQFAGQSLATLYNALAMPPELVKAHQHLDTLVDKAYGRTFANDNECVAHLFNLYAAATQPASKSPAPPPR